MFTVERKIEVPVQQKDPIYDEIEITDKQVEAGKHRDFVGGQWEKIGRHQLRFAKKQGLERDQKMVDIGCGSLRAGIRFVNYLDAGNYYGVDVNPTLIEAGYNNELGDKNKAKLPIENLRSTDRFDVDFGVKFDFAIANSVFTHVSLNHIRLCLHRLAPHMNSGGSFYATFLEPPEDTPMDGIYGKGRALRYQERNVFWYYKEDLVWCAERVPFTAEYIGDWGHPRNQMMMRFIRD